MWKYIVNKLIFSVISLFLASFIIYMAYTSVKSNPFIGQKGSLDPKVYVAKLSAFHINDPIIVRYFSWLKGVFSGDWGVLFNNNLGYTIENHPSNAIPNKFFTPFSNSMLVSIPAFLLGMFGGLALGTWAGYKRGKLTDQLINGFVIFFVAIPSFVFGAFALILGPKIGLPTLFESSASKAYMIKTIILPILVMTLISLASWTKIMRFEVSNILTTDYILAARTKGYSELMIFRRYVLRNALYPFINSFAYSFTIVFASSLFIERFFNIGGASTIMLEANLNGEINLVMFQLMFMMFLGIFLQMLADLLLFTVNPIVRANFASSTSPIAKIKFAMIRRQNEKSLIEGGKND